MAKMQRTKSKMQRRTTKRYDHPSGRASTIHRNIDGMSPAKGCPKWRKKGIKDDSTMTITAQGPIRFKRIAAI